MTKDAEAAASGTMGRLRDGGGVASDADWCYPRAPDSLKQLCVACGSSVLMSMIWFRVWPGLYLQESARLC